MDGRRASRFFYLPISLGAWLPWWPVAGWTFWRRTGSGRFAGWHRRVGVEGWIVLVGLLLFSLVNSKLPTYTIVLAPWAALLMARAIAAEPTLPRLLPACGFALVAVVGVAVVPPLIESRVGPNSSVREVCRILREHGARDIDADHHWPGMEFYLPDSHVRYLLRAGENLRERAGDPGAVPDRFIDPRDWLDLPGKPGAFPPATGDRWLVRFRKQRESPFNTAFAQGETGKVATVGQFDVYHVLLSDGRVAGPAETPR